jgi:hypothetical protein
MNELQEILYGTIQFNSNDKDMGVLQVGELVILIKLEYFKGFPFKLIFSKFGIGYVALGSCTNLTL